MKKPFRTSGQVFFHHKKGILWRTLKPLRQTLLITPSGFFTVKEGNRVVRSAMGEKSDLFFIQLYDFFRGDMSGLEKTFLIKIHQVDQNYHIDLTPRGESVKEFLTKIKIDVDSKGRLRQIEMFEPNQTTSRIEFTQFEPLERLKPRENLLYEQIQP